jgi:hypothetical protein
MHPPGPVIVTHLLGDLGQDGPPQVRHSLYEREAELRLSAGSTPCSWRSKSESFIPGLTISPQFP